MEKEKHINNEYAQNIKGEAIYILDVNSGRNGYYCRGCKAEMEARISEKQRSYFAHIPKDVKIERKCTYSDETYRHFLAKEILQRIKQVKVPALYKYPPNGTTGKPIKIRDARLIQAIVVRNERQFYEDEAGNIQFGRKIDFEKAPDKYLLIQPDVAFFDSKNDPILLVEIVATHKIPPEKLAKIKRLGIDMIQVLIPKGSPAEIEACFSNTNRTKWVFNYEQETTKYVPLSKGNNEGVLPLDQFQKSLLATEESYECRKVQIGNLIRGIRKCLASEPYRSAERSIRAEITRVEKNTERDRLRLRELQEEHRRRIEDQFKLENEAVARLETELDQERSQFRDRQKELEQRYYSKATAIEAAQNGYQPECQTEIDRIEKDLAGLGAEPTSVAEYAAAVRGEAISLEENYEGKIYRLEEGQRAMGEDIRELRARRADLPAKYRGIEAEVRARFSAKENNIEAEFAEQTEACRKAFERLRADILDAIENGDSRGSSPFRRRLKKTMDQGQLFFSISERQRRIQRLRIAKQLLNSGAYKDWV